QGPPHGRVPAVGRGGRQPASRSAAHGDAARVRLTRSAARAVAYARTAPAKRDELSSFRASRTPALSSFWARRMLELSFFWAPRRPRRARLTGVLRRRCQRA